MTSVEAVPEEIRSAGLAARSLAAQVGSVNLAGPADSVSGWMPGGQAASAADELAGAWSREVAGLDQLLDTYGANLQVCEAAFRGQDEYNAGALPRAAQ